MELLFNKNNTGGATEIKNALGFTDADIKFDTLKPFLIPATDIVIDLIGQPTYDSLVTIYKTGTQTPQQKEFLERAQAVIAKDAIRQLAANSDLAFTPNGRVNRVEENQKIAFEWQIVNSDRRLERDYYRLFDRLIKFMDANVTEWKSTDAYKATHNLFIRKASEIDDYFNIDGSRLLFIKLSPGIAKAEREEILPRITKTRFDELKTKLKANEEVDAILVKLIQEAVVYKALAWGIPRLSSQLFPEGFMQVADNSGMTVSARKSVEKTQAESYAQKFKQDADDALLQLEKHIHSLTATQSEPIPYQPYKRNFDPQDNFVDC